ncbi:MAG: TPM domain-containing protein [Burkholderiales bacterium]
MGMTAQERQEINELAQQFEAATGAQAVAAVVGKADEYPDIPWKAFALGAAMAAMAVVADEFIHPDWASIHTPLRDVAAILVAGVLSCVVAMAIPAFGRLFLNRDRARAEVRQYAQSLFLQREVFATAERVGILILVARFERRVVILPDSGIARHVSARELDEVIAVMAPHLAASQPVQAFRAGFGALAALLKQKNVNPSRHGNELADGAVIEEGA